jgi:hypothetical protein
MLSPDHHSNVPGVIQIVFDGQIGGWLALIPWAGPLEVPSVLPKESSDMAYDRIDHPVIVS